MLFIKANVIFPNLELVLHIGVHGLYIIKVLEFLNHLVDGLAFLGRYILQVIGDASKLSAPNPTYKMMKS